VSIKEIWKIILWLDFGPICRLAKGKKTLENWKEMFPGSTGGFIQFPPKDSIVFGNMALGRSHAMTTVVIVIVA